MPAVRYIFVQSLTMTWQKNGAIWLHAAPVVFLIMLTFGRETAPQTATSITIATKMSPEACLIYNIAVNISPDTILSGSRLFIDGDLMLSLTQRSEIIMCDIQGCRDDDS